MSWFNKDTPENDKIVAQTGEILLDGVSNADFVNKVELHNGRNLRDQLTVEEAIEMEKEVRLRNFGHRRN